MGAALDDDPRIGQMVANKYRLEQLLGSGGVGMVYRAENVLLGRTVAIKLLKPEYAQNKDLVGRFIREARAANLVRHVNVVDVLDVGLDDLGVPYIVQELLHGEDLSHHLYQHGPLASDVAMELLLPIIDAVAFAHVMGVVHRDLKPENIFITQIDGELLPKVLDFGISKMAVPSESVRITSTGISMGTPAYMSPEQIQRFGEIDARADVWALGVILYEMVTGQLPFEAATPGALFVEICTKEPIGLSDRLPEVDPDFDRVVMRCLRREPDERYPTAAEFARDLRNLLDGHAPEPTQRIALVSLPPAPIPVQGEQTSRRVTGSGEMRRTTGQRRPTDNRRVTARTRSSDPNAMRRTSGVPRARTNPEPISEPEHDSVGPVEAEPRLATPQAFDPTGTPPARRRGLLLLGLGLVVVLGGAAIAFVSMRDTPTRTARADTVSTRTHSLVVQSTPSGASVAEDGHVLGTTPLTIGLDRAQPRQFVVSLPGYAPYVIHQDRTDDNFQVVAALTPSAPSVGTQPAVNTVVATTQTPPVVPSDPTVAAHANPPSNNGGGAPRRPPHGRPTGTRGAHASANPATPEPTTPPPPPTPSNPSLQIRFER